MENALEESAKVKPTCARHLTLGHNRVTLSQPLKNAHEHNYECRSSMNLFIRNAYTWFLFIILICGSLGPAICRWPWVWEIHRKEIGLRGMGGNLSWFWVSGWLLNNKCRYWFPPGRDPRKGKHQSKPEN